MKKSSLFKHLAHHNFFGDLGNEFSVATKPEPIRTPIIVCRNSAVETLLGIEGFDDTEIARVLSGNQLPEIWQPVAHRYAGHQYGKFNHFLGDGRSLHLTDLKTAQGNMDICLKGSGKTAFARSADGRCNLATGIKEFLLSAALDRLAIPTSLAPVLVSGKNPISRSGGLQPASVLTRVAPTFIRFGYFENFYYSGNHRAIKKLADFCIEHYFDEPSNQGDDKLAEHRARLAQFKKPSRYQALLAKVINNTAKLIAHWQCAGFIHGNMNTDNQSILGLTLDHSSGEFMQAYEPGYVSCSDDEKALFAFDQQPNVGAWNCVIFAKTLSSLLTPEQINSELEQYSGIFESYYLSLMLKRLGLGEFKDGDRELIRDLLIIFEKNKLLYNESLTAIESFSQLKIKELNKPLTDHLNQLNWFQRYQQRMRAATKKQKTAINSTAFITAATLKAVTQSALEDQYSAVKTQLQTIQA